MSKPYRVCPKCGCNLDHGERCDCEDRTELDVAQDTADTAARSWTWLRTQRTRQHNRRPETIASPYSCRCLCPAHERRAV